MPNLKHAKKALRNQNRKAGINKAWKIRIKNATDELNNAIKTGAKNVNETFSAYQKIVDKATKNHIIHRNKADRLKSNLYKKLRDKD